MRDSLLWVYEGQTQYYGQVLAARAGFLTSQQALDSLAGTAAAYDARAGRNWRNLQDTTNDPIIAAPSRHPLDELAAQRGLLFRRPAPLARCRYADPRALGGQTLARHVSRALSSESMTAIGVR